MHCDEVFLALSSLCRTLGWLPLTQLWPLAHLLPCPGLEGYRMRHMLLASGCGQHVCGCEMDAVMNGEACAWTPQVQAQFKQLRRDWLLKSCHIWSSIGCAIPGSCLLYFIMHIPLLLKFFLVIACISIYVCFCTPGLLGWSLWIVKVFLCLLETLGWSRYRCCLGLWIPLWYWTIQVKLTWHDSVHNYNVKNICWFSVDNWKTSCLKYSFIS